REALLRGPRRPQQALGEAAAAVMRIDEGLLRKSDGHRVHGEVAADEILLDGVAVGHLRLARGAVVRLGPVRGDLDLVAVLLRTDRAEGDPDLPDRVREGRYVLQQLVRSQ